MGPVAVADAPSRHYAGVCEATPALLASRKHADVFRERATNAELVHRCSRIRV